jgi:hypothetical protein
MMIRNIQTLLFSVILVATTSLTAQSTNAALERHYDTTLAANVPLFTDAVRQFPSVPVVFRSTPFVPFATTATERTTHGNVEQTTITGTDEAGTEYLVHVIRRTRSSVTVTFSRNGQRDFEVTGRFTTAGRAAFSARTRFFRDPSYDFDIHVTSAPAADAARAFDFRIDAFGGSAGELLWANKPRVDVVRAYGEIARTKTPVELPLENYFSLLLADGRNVGIGLQMMEGLVAAAEADRAAAANETASTRHDGSKFAATTDRTVDSTEGGLCAVGSLGANVVFTPVGSFGYAIICGAAAMID